MARHTEAVLNRVTTMATKSKAQRAKRKGTKAGGESPCTKCRGIVVKVKRTRLGRFAKK